MARKSGFPHPSEKEEKRINTGITQDPDNPEWTDEMFAKARPAREVLPAAFLEGLETLRADRQRGRPKAEKPKIHIGFRLDADLVAAIKAGARGYNARVEAILREAFQNGKL